MKISFAFNGKKPGPIILGILARKMNNINNKSTCTKYGGDANISSWLEIIIMELLEMEDRGLLY